MSSTQIVSIAQIGAQLDSVLQRDANASVVAIRASTKGPWPEFLQRAGRRYNLRWCESRLALREALTDLETAGAGTDGLILMTPLRDTDVPDDVASRLARARIFQPKGWEILRGMFGAKETDARLGHYDWMPDLLIDSADGKPFTPVPGDFLDLETAWREVFRLCLGLDATQSDAAALMRWAQRPDLPVLLDKLAPKARRDILQWMSGHAGPAGSLIVRCIDAGRGFDAASLGLVCDVVFSAAAEGIPELAQAAVRMERYVADQHISVSEGREWASQATRLLEHTSPEDAMATLERADAIMRELRVADFAYRSDWLRGGFEQRLAQFAQVLSGHVSTPTDGHAAQLEDAANAVTDHHLAPQQPLRVERVRMARRLARWLLRAPSAAANLAQHIATYADDGAFVDWARFKLLGGDELPELSAAYASLRLVVSQRRGQLNNGFATTLATSLRESASAGERVLPVESVLQELVGRLASSHPVLLLVVDGLSLSIFRELFERPERHGWVELAPEAGGKPLLGLAAFPTVTTVSRTSLLCGRIAVGAASNEKTAFRTYPALLPHGGAIHSPKLFHKGDLSTGGSLAADVRDALADASQRVVGVVYNAVDDHLSGPDQLHQRWSLEDLRLLLPLLREARDSRRIVIVTADHGHMLEENSSQIPGGINDRWRAGSQIADAREIMLSGDRVLTPEGSNEAICIWSESARYTGRKNGYHGGASLAEAIVPMSVFAPFGVNVGGWIPAPPPQPVWWDLPEPTFRPAQPALVSRTPAKRAPAKPTAQGGPQVGLFGDEDLPVLQRRSAPEAADWVTVVLTSALYASQRQLAARVALPDEQMRTLLHSLDERGGKLTRAALAQRLRVPELRLGGMLSAARRMLNVDQAQVLTVDDASDTVEINHALLMQQFSAPSAGDSR
ncbi:BREX-2 system phosphatase PglZ [Paraburkholderia sp. 32]|uniref:BREX-2 system phosphatase PglZ n=1 Tax=Paraburkholderia sp. 32 TaxID=2991057 RepID=UPI003D2617C4